MSEYDIVRASEHDYCIIRDGVVFAYAPTRPLAVYIVAAVKEYRKEAK
jgi:hypothetical protein